MGDSLYVIRLSDFSLRLENCMEVALALVRSFSFVQKGSNRVHPTQVDCQYSVVTAADGRRYLQLDTHGSDEREMPEKISQTLQIDATAAARLRKILDEVFPS